MANRFFQIFSVIFHSRICVVGQLALLSLFPSSTLLTSEKKKRGIVYAEVDVNGMRSPSAPCLYVVGCCMVGVSSRIHGSQIFSQPLIQTVLSLRISNRSSSYQPQIIV